MPNDRRNTEDDDFIPDKVVVKTEGAEIPSDDCIIVAENGTFEQYTTLLFDTIEPCHRPIQGLKQQETGLNLRIGKVPVSSILGPMIGFLRAVYEKKNTEAAGLLYYNPDTRDFKLHVPDKQKAESLHVGYKTTTIFKGYMLIGGVHSHKDGEAYHSGEDLENTLGKDGLHITIGHLHQPGAFSIIVKWFVNGRGYELKPLTTFDGLEKFVPKKGTVEAREKREAEKAAKAKKEAERKRQAKLKKKEERRYSAFNMFMNQFGSIIAWTSVLIPLMAILCLVIYHDGATCSGSSYYTYTYTQPRPTPALPKQPPKIKPQHENSLPKKKSPGVVSEKPPRLLDTPIADLAIKGGKNKPKPFSTYGSSYKPKEFPAYLKWGFWIWFIYTICLVTYAVRRNDTDGPVAFGHGDDHAYGHGTKTTYPKTVASYTQLYCVPDESFPEDWLKKVKAVNLSRAEEVVHAGAATGTRNYRNWWKRNDRDNADRSTSVRGKRRKNDPGRLRSVRGKKSTQADLLQGGDKQGAGDKRPANGETRNPKGPRFPGKGHI